MSIVTVTYVLGLDGANGELICGPITNELVAVKDVTQFLYASFQIPSQPKGLYRFIVNVYHESSLVLIEEAIFCPPNMVLHE